MKNTFKYFKLIIVAVIGGFVGLVHASNEQKIYPESSALLLSTHYSQIVTELASSSLKNGQVLRIQGFSNLKIGNTTYTYINLYVKINNPATISKWTPYGQIVGVIKYGNHEEIEVTGAYFKPNAEGPGNALQNP